MATHWYDTMASGDTIDYDNWNNMKTEIRDTAAKNYDMSGYGIKSMYATGNSFRHFGPQGRSMYIESQAGQTLMIGHTDTGHNFTLQCNSEDTYPYIKLWGDGGIQLLSKTSVRMDTDGDRLFNFSLVSDTWSTIDGGDDAGDDLQIRCNTSDVYPALQLWGGSDAVLNMPDGHMFRIYDQGNSAYIFNVWQSATNDTIIKGGGYTTYKTYIHANYVDTNPNIMLTGSGAITFNTLTHVIMQSGGTQFAKISPQGDNTTIYGSESASHNLTLQANSNDSYPLIKMWGNGSLVLNSATDTLIKEEGYQVFKFDNEDSTGWARMWGSEGSGLKIMCNSTDENPSIFMWPSSDIMLRVPKNKRIKYWDINADDTAYSFMEAWSDGDEHTYLYGTEHTDKDFMIYANKADNYPRIRLIGSGSVYIYDNIKSTYLRYPYDYIIFSSNGSYHRRSSKDGDISSNTDGTTLIQNVLDSSSPATNYKKKVLMIGDFVISSVIVPSYTDLELHGTISPLPSLSYTNYSGMIEVGRSGSMCTDIEIHGGKIYGNFYNSASFPTTTGDHAYVCGIHSDTNMRRVKIYDVTIENFKSLCMLERLGRDQSAQSYDITIRDMNLKWSHTGIELYSNGWVYQDVHVSNIHGHYINDDIVAIVGHWGGITGASPDVRNILVDNVQVYNKYTVSGGAVVKLDPGDTATGKGAMSNIIVNNINAYNDRDCYSENVAGVILSKGQNAENININNVTLEGKWSQGIWLTGKMYDYNINNVNMCASSNIILQCNTVPDDKMSVNINNAILKPYTPAYDGGTSRGYGILLSAGAGAQGLKNLNATNIHTQYITHPIYEGASPPARYGTQGTYDTINYDVNLGNSNYSDCVFSSQNRTERILESNNNRYYINPPLYRNTYGCVVFKIGDNTYIQSSNSTKVDYNSNPTTIIQSGIDFMASGGGTLFIKSGSYYPVNVTIKENVFLEGEMPSKVDQAVVTLYGSGANPVIKNKNTDISTLEELTQNIGIKNLVIDGSGCTNAVNLRNIDNAWIENNKITNATWGLRFLTSTSTIAATTRPGAYRIYDNVITTTHGIYIEDATQCWVQNNWFENSDANIWLKMDGCNKIRVFGNEFNGMRAQATGSVVLADNSNYGLTDCIFANNWHNPGAGVPAFKMNATEINGSNRLKIDDSVLSCSGWGWPTFDHYDINIFGPNTRKSKNGGWASVADGGTITHQLYGKPKRVSITPSGSNPLAYSFKVNDTNITVYHTSPDSEVFSWTAEHG